MIALAALSASPLLFAAAGGKTGGAPTPVPVPAGGGASIPQPATAAAPASNDTPFTSLTKAIPIPDKRPSSGKRGGKSIYPFEKMEIGESFGVVGKTFKNVNSTVASANKRWAKPDKLVDLSNPDGTPKMIDVPVPGQPGVTTPVRARGPERVFFASPVDPKTDPDKAEVRVWRKS